MVIARAQSPGGGNSAQPVDSPPVNIGGIEPVFISLVTMDLNGNSNTITDQCGRSEVRRSGNTNWSVQVEGIITDTQLEPLQAVAEADEPVEIQADLLGSRSGEYVIEKCTLKHTDSLNGIYIPSYVSAKRAYEFQIQTKDPATESGGGGG